MARSPLSLKQMLLLASLLIISLFSATAMAADSKSTAATQKTTTAATSTAAAATSTAKDASTAADSATSKESEAATSAAKSAATSAATSDASGKTTARITATGTDTESVGALPTITASTSATATNKLDLPTLSTADTAVPTYPAPTVPPTQNAPFMQHSSLPSGTVFIAVGSILGGLAVAILLWRALVAYLLHRSIARASLAQSAAMDKGPFMPAASPFYKYTDRESSLNLAGAAAGSVASGRGVRRTNRGPTPSATPSMSNLFFSPTAPGANAVSTAGNRDSRLLPSGFYAAGSAAPAGHGQAIGLSNLRPDGRAPSRHMGSTPPDSPSFGPSRSTPLPRNDLSTSSVNLNMIPPATGRTPSAYLDDLLDEQPHLFPPGAPGAPSAPGGGPAHQHTYSQSSQSSRRY